VQAVDHPSKRRRRHVLGWLRRVAAVLALVAAGFVWGHWITPPRDQCTAFDAEQWRTIRDDTGPASATVYRRLKPQVDSLTGCPALLKGRSRAAVRDLLGAPVRPASRSGPGSWGYWVGVPEGQSDWPSMVIAFDADGRVISVRAPE
jgi:hypothetical protein